MIFDKMGLHEAETQTAYSGTGVQTLFTNKQEANYVDSSFNKIAGQEVRNRLQQYKKLLDGDSTERMINHLKRLTPLISDNLGESSSDDLTNAKQVRSKSRLLEIVKGLRRPMPQTVS
jgi:hypothetical protein